VGPRLTGRRRYLWPPGRLLRDLDRLLLPPLARGLDRLGGGRHRPHRRRPQLLTVAALALVAAVLGVAVWTAGHRPPPDAGISDVARVGVVDGQSIPGYVQSSRNELARLVGDGKPARPTYALVTLKAYLAPGRLAPVLVGVDVAEVYARVPLPDRQTEIVHVPAARVPADVLAGMAQVAQRKDAEAAEFAALSSKLTGNGGAERRLRTAYAAGARQAFAEATAYRSHCSCLYAAVVRGEPAALDRVAGRPEVRAVDPAPEVRQLDRAVFLPPLPEQTGPVRPPADRPRSSPSPKPDRPVRTISPSPSRPAETPSPSVSPPAAAPSETPSPSPPSVVGSCTTGCGEQQHPNRGELR
jgi:hypothetical protein